MTSKANLKILEEGRLVIRTEAENLLGLVDRLDDSFFQAVNKIIKCKGRVITMGMGKAGHIAMKVAATMASTGTPACFVHPAEAMHGDLGMLVSGDVALLFSNSGETEELCRLLPHLKQRGVYSIAITSHNESSMARISDLVLTMGAIGEACPLQLAPSSSTTCMLALGDAMALAALKARGFTKDDFATLHPGGALGMSLKTVGELMRSGERCPLVTPETKVPQVVAAISKARSGCACVIDENGSLLGVFTDGDFRRAWAGDEQLAERVVAEVMTKPGISLDQHVLVREAKNVMFQRHVNAIPVVDGKKRVLGLLDIQDI